MGVHVNRVFIIVERTESGQRLIVGPAFTTYTGADFHRRKHCEFRQFPGSPAHSTMGKWHLTEADTRSWEIEALDLVD
jgi:hypothetical protein